MQGIRIYPDDEGRLLFTKPGQYGKRTDGKWDACLPNGIVGGLSGSHDIVEHEDGTITVSPSILLEGQWHGYLRNGIWEEV